MSAPRIADHYEPRPRILCPVCARPLSQWKGNDGPCRGLLWKENEAEPSLELLTAEQRQEEGLRDLRLREDFAIHTTCAHCKDGALGIKAHGTVKDNVWVETEIVEVADHQSGDVIYSKFD